MGTDTLTTSFRPSRTWTSLHGAPDSISRTSPASRDWTCASRAFTQTYPEEHSQTQSNNGDLIGSWIGRGGQGAQAWSNYWFSPRNRLQFNFRHQKVSQEFLPGGGTLTDVGARGDYWVRSNLGLSASVQYERWLFPVIQPNAQRNVTGAVGIVFQPEKLFRRASPSDNGGRP